MKGPWGIDDGVLAASVMLWSAGRPSTWVVDVGPATTVSNTALRMVSWVSPAPTALLIRSLPSDTLHVNEIGTPDCPGSSVLGTSALMVKSTARLVPPRAPSSALVSGSAPVHVPVRLLLTGTALVSPGVANSISPITITMATPMARRRLVMSFPSTRCPLGADGTPAARGLRPLPRTRRMTQFGPV